MNIKFIYQGREYPYIGDKGNKISLLPLSNPIGETIYIPVGFRSDASAIDFSNVRIPSSDVEIVIGDEGTFLDKITKVKNEMTDYLAKNAYSKSKSGHSSDQLKYIRELALTIKTLVEIKKL